MTTQHDEACTWERHLSAGETAPGQTFWGQLNYLWCQANCQQDEDAKAPIIDVTDVLRAHQQADGSIRIG